MPESKSTPGAGRVRNWHYYVGYLIMVSVAAAVIVSVFESYKSSHPQWYDVTTHNLIGGR